MDGSGNEAKSSHLNGMKNETLLHRQVHPSFVIGEFISSQAFSSQVFTPTEKDEGMLSVYNGNKFSAEESSEHYRDLGFTAVGVVAVSKQECNTQQLEVVENNDPFDGHCFIDYRGISKNQIKKKAKKLKQLATERDWLFRP